MSNLSPEVLDLTKRRQVAEKYGTSLPQFSHRVEILRLSSIRDGDKILEIGCGQGDCTVVLALAYPRSRIDAIDPGPLDYGTPETLGQARERIKGYEFGERINFHQGTPIDFLANAGEEVYDVAVLCHCLWYFAGTSEVLNTLKAVRGKAKKLCIAEWGLQASTPEAHVHVLAALTRAACEAHIPNSLENIRTPISPVAIRSLAHEAGWKLRADHFIRPTEGLEDSGWEVSMLLRENKVSGENYFRKRVEEEIKDKRVTILLETMLESVKSAAESVGGKDNTKCMNIWVGDFE